MEKQAALWVAGAALAVVAVVALVGWVAFRAGQSDRKPWDDAVVEGELVRLTYTGSDCRDDASVEVEEHEDRVVLTVWETVHAMSCNDMGVRYEVTAELDEPLGDRELVDGTRSASAPDPRWVFYTGDRHRYTSPWYAGAHRIMIPFGCTRAPYYSPDPRCAGDRGFHHGIDVAMPCGTPLRAARRVRVLTTGSLGPAYGSSPLLLRNQRLGFDLVIGHTRRVYVEPGDVVRRGTLIARASDDGAPDGCHLHFEQRAVGGGLSSAVWPRTLLGLSR